VIRLTEPINPREPSFSFGSKGCTCREEESPLSISLGRSPSRRESDFRRGRDSPTPTSWNLSKQRGGGATELLRYKQQQCYQTLIGPLALLVHPPLLLTSAGPNPLGRTCRFTNDFPLYPSDHGFCRFASIPLVPRRWWCRSLGCSPDLTTLRNTNVR